MSGLLLQKPLFTRVFLYLLMITGSTVILKWSLWSLFASFCMYFLTKGLWGVHFEPEGCALFHYPFSFFFLQIKNNPSVTINSGFLKKWGCSHIIYYIWLCRTERRSVWKVSSLYGKLPANRAYQSAASISIYRRGAFREQNASGAPGQFLRMRKSRPSRE